MRIQRSLAGLAVAALLLTACSSNPEQPADGGTVSEDASSDTTSEPPSEAGSDAATEATAQTPEGDADGPLVVYTGRSINLVQPLLDDFQVDTGIPIEVRDGDTAELALLLQSEGDATDADVFLAQSPGAVAFLDQQELLAPLDDAVVELVDPAYHAADDGWVGLTARQRVLVYNEDIVAEADLPASVLDLVDPEWAGRFAVAPTNGSFQDFVSALRATEGDDAAMAWLEGIAANDVQTYGNNSSIVEAVGRGEVEMGLVNHYYNQRFLAEDPSLPSRNHRFPDGDIGSLLMLSTASVLESTDKPAAAAQLITYLLDTHAQEYFQTETFEYPLSGGVEPLDSLPSLQDQELPEVDYSALGADLTTTLDMIRDAGLE